MHMMNTAHPSSSQGGYKLPGFKDFLREIEPKESFSFEPHETTELSTSVFNKRQESHPSHDDDLFKCFFARPARLPTPDHVHLVPESSLVPQSMGNPQLLHAENTHFALKSEPKHHIPVEKGFRLPFSPFRAISPFRPGRRLQPLILAPEGHHMKLGSSSYRSSVGKITSNDKHKQNEKHRRDEMGAYVQAADIIRASLHPGLLFNCPVCIPDVSLSENVCSSPSMTASVTAIAIEAPSKKTKNQSIEEGLMWQFSAILHGMPDEVGSRLDALRSLASQKWREKQVGRNNGAEVLMELLRKMRYGCELHEISPCACGKHEVEDWPTDDSSQLITPPSSSSRTSPVVGQKQLRETTEEEEEVEKNRRVRRRSIGRL